MKLIIEQLSKELEVKASQIEKTINLIDEGNTIPFIARYRKEVTGGLSDEILRDLDERLIYLRKLNQRKEDVIAIIEEQGKLTEKLRADIMNATMMQRVEDLYRPYKQKKLTRGTKAKAKGLESLSTLILLQEINSGDIEDYAKEYINEEKEVLTIKDAINGAKDIIAEIISDDPVYRTYFRSYVKRYGKITTVVKKQEEDENEVYKMYYDYEESLKTIAKHRVLAFNRGEKEKILKVDVKIEASDLTKYLNSKVIINKKSIFVEILEEAIEDSYSRLIFPSIERQMRSEITEDAQKNAIEVFAKNTKSLLMIPPIDGLNVLAVDPSFRTGCKIAILNKFGKLLDYTTIYPNAPQHKVEESKEVLKKLINKYDVDIIPIGNGTASRETAQIVSELITDIEKDVYYTIVSEDGASVYSASKLASEEFPEINVSIRGAISIGRRLQDPLAELVKIDPMSIGVGQYQHDLNKTNLNNSLTGVVEDCVNSVGVDLNTASATLLSYISGISKTVSKNIVEYREGNDKFEARNQLKKVKGLGPKAFEQSAGFLRIRNGKNILDNTGVHPESYDATKKMLKLLGFKLSDISSGKIENINEEIKNYGGLKQISDELEVGILTLQDIVKELLKPGRDPREDMPKPIFQSGVLKMEDLKVDMMLKGTVRNVVAFGCFVDIGIKQDGLVHISQLSDSYVSNPMDVVKIGDIVDVRIIEVDIKRERIQLSMKKK